jgi:hypothetical protein
MIVHLICILSNLPSDASALQSSISALEREIAALDKSSLSPEFWLPFFTVLVAIGVAVEIFVVLRDHKEDMGEWELCKLIPDKPSSRKLWLEIASVILVTVGIVGELGIGLWISHINGQLRSKNAELRSKSDQLLALVTQQAGEAKDSALIAKASAKAAGVSAGKAQRTASKVEKQADELRGELQATKAQLAAVDAKRGELEKSLTTMAVCTAPRVLPIWTMVGVKAAVDPLKPFAAYQAIIEFVRNDAEARRAGSNIFLALKQAGWTTVTITPVDNVDDGVEIQPSVAIPGDRGSQEAADALVDFLHSYDWQAKPGWLLDGNNAMIVDPKAWPPNTLRIKVGLYPAVSFVVPRAAKDFAAAMEQVWQARENQIKKSEQEQAKRYQEYLKKLTPQQAIEFSAEDKKWKQQREMSMGRYSQPCQPLNGLVPPPLR